MRETEQPEHKIKLTLEEFKKKIKHLKEKGKFSHVNIEKIGNSELDYWNEFEPYFEQLKQIFLAFHDSDLSSFYEGEFRIKATELFNKILLLHQQLKVADLNPEFRHDFNGLISIPSMSLHSLLSTKSFIINFQKFLTALYPGVKLKE